MSGKIFINYRRGDDAGFAHALYQRLQDEFTAADLFMDVQGHIKPGDDFVEVLVAQVAASDVLLVVIGPRWSDLLTARQSDPDDFVAIEIKAALDQGKRVIPVLVGGAPMPPADILPEQIRSLARRQAVGLRPERFLTDCQGLVAALKEHLVAASQERAARTEVERQTAETARHKAQEFAAERANAAEELVRAESALGLSAEEISKAEELANWNFVKVGSDTQELRDHLARFPGGTTERYALAKLDELVWVGLGSAPSIGQLEAYLNEFPKGVYVSNAQAEIGKRQKSEAGAKAAERRSPMETVKPDPRHSSLPPPSVDEAIRRILKCAETKADTLDLGGLYLREVPTEIQRLTWLKTLHLGYGSNEREIYDDKKSTSQMLQINAIKSIPEQVFLVLQNLEKIDFHAGMLERLPASIGSLKHLSDLNAQSNLLCEIPSTVGDAVALRRINLQDNSLTAIPTEIGRLKKLVSLNLSWNRLSSLPPSIGELTALQRLYLRGNALQSVPSDLGRLIKLRDLALGGNDQLMSIPHEIFALPALMFFDVTGPFAKKVPAEFVAACRRRADVLEERISSDYKAVLAAQKKVEELSNRKNSVALTEEIAKAIAEWEEAIARHSSSIGMR